MKNKDDNMGLVRKCLDTIRECLGLMEQGSAYMGYIRRYYPKVHNKAVDSKAYRKCQ